MALPRTLEPEAMDAPDEAFVYDAMDHSAVNARFGADFLAAHGPCRGGRILDLGCGPAWIPIVISRLDANARLVAIDLSERMIDVGRANVAAQGLGDRIELLVGDAKDAAFPGQSFEAVISNSIVHHIPDPAPVCAEMVRLVAPGGTLFVRDLFRPESELDVRQIVQTYAGGEPAPAQALFEASLHAALTLDEIRAIVATLGCSEAGVQATSDRHWTWVWKRPG